MGLKNRDNNVQYVRIKDGKFYLGKNLDTAYEELEGLLTGLSFKNEEYEGTPQRKLIISLTDGEEVYQLGLNVETSNYSTFVSFLKNVDISKPITLHPKIDVKKEGDKDITRRSILISQNGKFAKSYFTKDDNHGLPKWETVVVGKKKITDKSAYLDFLENFVTTEFISKLNTLEQPTKQKTTSIVQNTKVVESADLPWEKDDDEPF